MEEEDDYLDTLMWKPSTTPPTKEMQEQELRLFGTVMSFQKKQKLYENYMKKRKKSRNFRLKYQKLHCAEVPLDNKQMYREELRCHRQRRLGRRYHRDTAQRLGVIKPLSSSSSSSDSEEPEPQSQRTRDAMKELQLMRQKRLETARQNFQPERLLNVSIHHPCSIVREGRENVTAGTLEANLNGFRFSSTPFEIDVRYGDIKYAFTQDGDDEHNKDPLCHLHLHKPIMVGTEMTQNIQFPIVQTLERRISQDSDMFDNEQQKGRGDDDNKLMREFRCKVDRMLDPLQLKLTFKWVDKKRGFYGEVHPKDHPPFSATFVFSYFTLIQLEHIPFTVVTLEDVELVNLVEDGSGMETINMTIVFKDFERDVLQINSIPKAKRISIKESLNLPKVKYYENKMDIPDWEYKLKEIRDYPEKFIGDGGWKFLDVEASAYYSDSSGDMYSIGSYSSGYGTEFGFDKYSIKEPGKSSDSDPGTKELLIQKKWAMEERRRVMVVSSDECDSDPKIREKGKKGTTQTKLSTAVRRRRKLVMSEESSDEE